MSGYYYARKKPSEIEEIAERILREHENRMEGNCLDIELLVEDYGCRILPRSLPNEIVAYTPKDPRFIVITAHAYSYRPNIRYTAAEELSHRILEYKLYGNGQLPKGAKNYELTRKQRKDIEDNAEMLAGALLMPKVLFLAEWTKQRGVHATDGYRPPLDVIRKALNGVADIFGVICFMAWRRARDLGQITHDDYSDLNRTISL